LTDVLAGNGYSAAMSADRGGATVIFNEGEFRKRSITPVMLTATDPSCRIRNVATAMHPD